jgi:hypothetical protein
VGNWQFAGCQLSCQLSVRVIIELVKKLELLREAKLYRLIPGRTKQSRLEASGVALLNNSIALVAFDNLNQIASVAISLTRSRHNGCWPAPSLGAGFEDIAADRSGGSAFGLIESVEDTDGVLRGFVAEYDRRRRLRDCTPLAGRFEKANKGFEGLAHARHQGREYLYALREANVRSSGPWRGRIDVFARPRGGTWQPSHRIDLPKDARFKDYSALAIRDGRMAIVSQQSARVWVAELDVRKKTVIRGSGVVYRFPGKHYRNVEGIDWLTKDTLIAVSDRMKKGQPAKSATKDQSIHIFRIPRSPAR